MKIRENENMVVIKNLPSNIVDEAWVVLKPGVKKKEKDFIQKVKNNKNYINKEKGYIVKEVEMVVKEYLNDINSLKNNRKYERILKKYNNLKKVFAITIISFGAIMLFQNFMV